MHPALFTDSQISLFSNFFIKNRSHDTIHTFKNYFVTVFSVSVFNFNKNKLNPNGPLEIKCNCLVRELEQHNVSLQNILLHFIRACMIHALYSK